MGTLTGLGSMFGGFFGASDLEDRFDEAIAQLKEFQRTAGKSMKGFQEKQGQAFTKGMNELANPTMAGDVADLRKMLVTTMQSGLSPFAKLYMEDANKFLEGRAITTGNLRSGSIERQRAELGRRVVADEFGRALGAFDALRKGDQTSANMFLDTALGFGQLEVGALREVGNATSGVAGALVGKGMVQQQKSQMLGAGIGGLLDFGIGAASTAFTGGANSLLSSFAQSFNPIPKG